MGKKKILVVDDNRAMLKFLTELLQKEGQHVVSAENGFQALHILTSFVPDIIFLDIVMPKIGGDKLCKIIRKMDHLKDCFIVIISGAVAELDFDFLELGANLCIAKGPFNIMTKHIMAAIKESYSTDRNKGNHSIKGLGSVHSRQMTRELLSRNRHIETILESIKEGILEVFSGKIVYANSAAATMLKKPQEKILVSYPTDLFDKKTRPKIEALLNNNEKPTGETEVEIPLELNGHQVVLKIMPMRGEESTSIIMMRDVTKQKELEAQLQHAKKMEAVGTIASGVAHNFRNTLAAILANSQIIQMNFKDCPEITEVMERIDTSVQRGAQLVDQLMSFSRKQAKEDLKIIDISKVVKESYNLMKGFLEKNIDFNIDVQENIYIIGNHSSLVQVAQNLLINSKDAMPEGGSIKIKAEQKKNMAVVTISDTGHGMDKKTMENCFNPFYTTRAIGKGTGLGLSTSYGIVKNHNGDISVESEINKGTMFKLYFPLAQA